MMSEDLLEDSLDGLKTIEDLLSDLFDDLGEKIDLFIDLYDKCKPKIIKRKYMKKGKKYYRLMISYNPISDILPSSNFLYFCSKKLISMVRNRVKI